MKALLSGEAARIVVLGKTNTLCEANSTLTTVVGAAEVRLLFAGCSDVTSVDVPTVTAAQELVQTTWACDRAVRLFLFLLDTDESDEDLIEYAECIEELIEQKAVREFVLNRLTAAALPQSVDTGRIFEATKTTALTREVFEHICSLQIHIQAVSSTFDKVHTRFFGGEDDRDDCLFSLTTGGTFRALAEALSNDEDISFLVLRTISNLRNYSAAIKQWAALLQPRKAGAGSRATITHNDHIIETEESFDRTPDKWQPQRGRAALESVNVQRAKIVSELKIGNISKVRSLVDALILEQQASSKPEHIAKTLDSLAQQAKDLGVTELQLEWAERAYRVNPSDPYTSGHHADALIGVGRIVDAEEVIRRTEILGNMAFAGNMRARILRKKGEYEAARDAYLKTAEAYHDDPEIWRAYVGAAECLRDLNRISEARREYERLVRRWPRNPTLYAGLASVLMEAGDFTHAIRNFGIAIKNHGGIVPKSGRANAYKLAGNYDESIRLYDECALEAPNSEPVLCGRAEVFKAKGDLEGALKAFDLAVERAPLSVQAVVGKAEVLEELKRFEEAGDVYKSALLKFENEEALQIGLARLMRRTHAAPDALAAFDALQKKLPENRWVAFNRADILRRVGKIDAALRAFGMLLEKWPTYEPAINTKISILIDAGRVFEARRMLKVETPQSAIDWRRTILHAMVTKAEGDIDSALEILSDAAKKVPFARERKLIKSTLACFNMERGHYLTAIRHVEEGPSPINNVIALHAYAVSPRRPQRDQASRLYSELISRDLDAEIIDLSHEIAKRFNVVHQKPEQSIQWISTMEQSLLLREVA